MQTETPIAPVRGIFNAAGDTREILPTDGEIAVMGKEGDIKTIWDRSKPAEVEHARATFNEMRKKGYLAFRCANKEGDKGEQMKEFDPDAQMMIMVPPMQGG